MNEHDDQARLLRIEGLIAQLTQQLRAAEAIRDTIILRLADNDGCHDRRPTAVR
ncbi:MAG: hypothetical protein WD894_20225 [Pirellulales bacterium]